MPVIRSLIALALILPVSLQLSYASEISVQALMPGLVVLKVDGERITLRQGQSTSDGIKLISANTDKAILDIRGEQKTFTMGTAISTTFTKPEQIVEVISSDEQGMFRAHGTINGQSVRFLIDTGATSVAMSSKEARKLGIQYRLHGIPTRAHTASGIATAWAVTLKSVRLGKLSERNVKGMVVDGDHPRHVLLGMTFLNRMKVEKQSNTMKISKKN